MTAAPPFFIVAIDGGAASGKSSSARALSERFHLLHADTGSYFRAATAEFLRQRVSPVDPAAIRSAVAALRLGTRVRGRAAEIEIDGRVPGEAIRSAEVNAAVSHFAANPDLRSALMAYERGQAEVARAHGFRGLVMDGRDIGTVIFPGADFRFFLHADPAERARRRASEGLSDAVAERDRLDSSRTTAPLACPAGAVSLDTTKLPLAAVVQTMADTIAARFAAA
jgi:cytidylate kinase